MKDRRIKRICNMLCILLMTGLTAAGCAKGKTEDLTELELGLESTDTAKDKNQDETVVPEKEIKEGASPEMQTEKDAGKRPADASTVFVHVCGAVKVPGVYELSGSARVYEAIERAGGVKDDAAAEALNQAEKVTDGERIYVPTKEELEKGIVAGEEPKVTKADDNNGGKININTADKEALKTLPGIGDAKADSIISYREANGPFGAIEDLMNVEGIKEGVFHKIEDKITATS